MSRRWRPLPLLLVLCWALTACVGMPNEGPVVVREETDVRTPAAGAFYQPRPPVTGAGPRQMVLGFLEAMRATPIKTAVAAEFLSTRARGSWTPERATVTYRDFEAPVGERTVRVDLLDAQRYDERGAWTGALGPDASRMEFAMVREDGEWRIDRVPDGLVVPASWFDDWFERALLHFVGPGGEVVVPEPVYVPSGDQFAASLVRGLLAGPGAGLEGVGSSAFPPGLALALNSVPIDDQGVADVVLEGGPDDVDDVLDEAVVAQLSWTLRQEPRIQRFRVTVNGRTLRVRAGGREVPVDAGRTFSPVGANATTDVFALRDGLLVRGSVGDLEETTGPFGTSDAQLRSVGVDPRGGWATGVSGDGRRLLRAPVTGSGEVTTLVAGATDLLPPVQDESERVWLVDRTPTGARVLVVGDRASATEVRVPGVTGTRVDDLLVSRDGTRLAAVVRGGTRDRLLLSRLVHTARGGVRALPARELDVPSDGALRITDTSWWTADAIAVLSDVSDVLAQMQVVPVDGAPDDTLGSGAVSRIRGDATRLITSPVEGASPYVEVDGRLRHLLDPTQGIVDLPSGVTRLVHAG